MNRLTQAVLVAILASSVPRAALPATTTPLVGLHYLVGEWSCSYRAGAARLDYRATYTYDRDGHMMREVTSWKGGGDEQVVAYDAKHGQWTAMVLDDEGSATVLHATGSNPNHIAYHSVYPDASITTTFDRVSATEYTQHATVRAGGKNMASVDTCKRDAP